MRRLFFVALATLVSFGALMAFNGANAQAEDLSPEEAASVQQNCVAIKTSLNQLHATDALLRVNRGQIYESMASKLMENFNQRLSSNSLDNMAMVAVTGNYRSALSAFRANYINYEQKLSQALRVDCKSQPNSFHTAVQEARELRETVHGDVLKLHRLIDDYRSAVNGFLVNYERVAE